MDTVWNFIMDSKVRTTLYNTTHHATGKCRSVAFTLTLSLPESVTQTI